MANESYRMISKDENMSDDNFEQPPDSRKVSHITRLIGVLIFIAVCTVLTCVALKLSEDGAVQETGAEGQNPTTINFTEEPTTIGPLIRKIFTTKSSIATSKSTTHVLTSIVVTQSTSTTIASTVDATVPPSKNNTEVVIAHPTSSPTTQITTHPILHPTGQPITNTTSSTALPTFHATTQQASQQSTPTITPTTSQNTTNSTIFPAADATASPTAPPTASSTASPTALPTAPPIAPPTAPQTTPPIAPPTASSTASPTVSPTSQHAGQQATTTSTVATTIYLADLSFPRKRRSIPTDKEKQKSGVSPIFGKPTVECKSSRCKTAGSKILSVMDNAVDPCQDFYGFACGGLKSTFDETDVLKRILEQLSGIDNTSSVALQKYKIFYDSCVLHERLFDYQNRLSRVATLVKEVGEMKSEQNEADIDLTKIFAKLILRQSLRIMDVDIEVESKKSNFLLKFFVPYKLSILKEDGPWLSKLSDDEIRCLSEQKKDLLIKDINLNKVHDSYVNCQKGHKGYLNSIAAAARAFGFLTGDETAQAQQIEGLKATIEGVFINQELNDQTKNALAKSHDIQKVSDLQANYKLLQWKTLLETLTGHTIDEATPVQVYFTEYFSKIFGELEKLPKWKVNNALLVMHAQDLYENLVLPKEKHTRENYCASLATKLLTDVSSHLYMKTWSEQDFQASQKLLTEVSTQLKTTLSESVKDAVWLDETSKASVLSKLQNEINFVFNKKDDIYNDPANLNAKYESLTFKNASNFIENTITVLETSKKLTLELQGKPYENKYLWSNLVNVYDSSPKSFYGTGDIAIPMGIIKYPVREDFPEYLTMAQLGLPIARELARQFDLVGIEHGITLSDTSKEKFAKYKNIMEDKALLKGTRNLQQHTVTYEADPQLSVNERIVDNAAVRMVSDALNNVKDSSELPWISASYSKEKLFFITVAQQFCKNTDVPEFMENLFESEILPPPLQVENIVTNSNAFQKVFECPTQSPMSNNPYGKLQFPDLQV